MSFHKFIEFGSEVLSVFFLRKNSSYIFGSSEELVGHFEGIMNLQSLQQVASNDF